jgi:hypothetical protein
VEIMLFRLKKPKKTTPSPPRKKNENTAPESLSN